MVVALGLAVALVALLQGGGDDDGGSAASTSPSSSVALDDEAARARAHTLAVAVALRPEDWGPAYKRGDPYEQDPASEYEVSKDCKGFTQAARSGTLAAVARSVVNNQTQLVGTTDVRVFADVATAESFMDDSQETTRRCPTQQFDKVRWADVRQATAPDVAGLEQVTTEEGTQTADGTGAKTDLPYVLHTGRQGATVVSVIAYETRANAATLTSSSTEVLQKLQQRLEAASQQ
ncbi:hypothetical protein [Streptomyces sp. NPDC026092]|uniref:hypothetical protein n=1 Tax=Streptomyces sp. NPDC026092 TaxID=3154797 RepID=UPI00340703AB